MLGASPHARAAPNGTMACTSTGGAHPRMRGQHFNRIAEYWSTLGASPHARAARRRRGARVRAPGRIPACAGSTPSSSPTPPAPGAHPRMRGQHGISRAPSSELMGASPHARAALDRIRARIGLRGRIPACAGSTLPDLQFLSQHPPFSFTFSRFLTSPTKRTIASADRDQPAASKLMNHDLRSCPTVPHTLASDTHGDIQMSPGPGSTGVPASRPP